MSVCEKGNGYVWYSSRVAACVVPLYVDVTRAYQQLD